MIMPRCHNYVICSWPDKPALAEAIVGNDFVYDVVKPFAITAPSAEVDHPSV